MNKQSIKQLGLAGLVAATSLLSSGCEKKQNPPTSIQNLSQTRSKERKSPAFIVKDPYALTDPQMSTTTLEGTFEITSFKYLGEKFYAQTNFANIGKLPFIIRKADDTKIIQEQNGQERTAKLSSTEVYAAEVLTNENTGKPAKGIFLDYASRDHGVYATINNSLGTNDYNLNQNLEIKLNRPFFTLKPFGEGKSYIFPKKLENDNQNELPFYTLEENVAYTFSPNGQVKLNGTVYTWKGISEKDYLSNLNTNNNTSSTITNSPSVSAGIATEIEYEE